MNNSDFMDSWESRLKELGSVGMLLNFIIALIMSRAMTKPPPDEVFRTGRRHQKSLNDTSRNRPSSIFQIGPIAVRWYGLTWLGRVLCTIYILIRRYQKDLNVDQVSDSNVL